MTLRRIMNVSSGAGPSNARSPSSSSTIQQQPQPPPVSPPPANLSTAMPPPTSPAAVTTISPPPQQITSPLPTNPIVIPLQPPALHPLSSAPTLPPPHLPPLPNKIPFPFAPTPLSTRLLEPTPSYLPQIPSSSPISTHSLWPPPHPSLLYALSDFTFTDANGAPAFAVNEYEWMGLAQCSSSFSSSSSSELEEDSQTAFLRRLVQPRISVSSRGRIITIRSKSSQLTPSAATAILLSGVYYQRKGWDTWGFDIWFLRSLAACEGVDSGGEGEEVGADGNGDGGADADGEHDSNGIDGIAGQGGSLGGESWGVKAVVGGVRYYALSLPYPKVTPPSTTTPTSSIPPPVAASEIDRRRRLSLTSITYRRFSIALTNHNKGSSVSNYAPWTVTSIGAPVALPVGKYGLMDREGEVDGAALVGKWVGACAHAVVGCWEEAIGGVVSKKWRRGDTMLIEGREVPVEDVLKRWSRQLGSVRIDLEVQGVEPLAERPGEVEGLVKRVIECEIRVSLLMDEIDHSSSSTHPPLATQNPLLSSQNWLLALGMAIGVTASVKWKRRQKS